MSPSNEENKEELKIVGRLHMRTWTTQFFILLRVQFSNYTIFNIWRSIFDHQIYNEKRPERKSSIRIKNTWTVSLCCYYTLIKDNQKTSFFHKMKYDFLYLTWICWKSLPLSDSLIFHLTYIKFCIESAH